LSSGKNAEILPKLTLTIKSLLRLLIAGIQPTYSASCWFNEKEHAIYSVAKLTLTKNRIPAADYPALKKCFENMAKDDSQHIVIKKQKQCNETEVLF